MLAVMSMDSQSSFLFFSFNKLLLTEFKGHNVNYGLCSFLQRKNGDMDKESLSLSEQVLSANPDYLTLWNFRREIFLHMKEEK